MCARNLCLGRSQAVAHDGAHMRARTCRHMQEDHTPVIPVQTTGHHLHHAHAERTGWK